DPTVSSSRRKRMSRKILIAEDNPANQEYLTELLCHFGYDVRVTSDGKKALDEVARVAPDLILLDIDMPVLTGREVLTILRSNPQYTSLPIVSVTAYA